MESCYKRNSTMYKIAGTKTFRLGSASILDRWGTNMQNIEKGARGMYVADEGRLLCQVDQSGAEALVVSYLCRDGNYRALFANNVKPHVFVALHNFADIWKKHYDNSHINTALSTPIAQLKSLPFWKELDTLIKSSDNWKSSERYYYIAKMIVHASSYGMQGGTFQMNVLEKSRGEIVLTRAQCDALLAGFHRLFPEIHEWHRTVERAIREIKCLRNLQGYPRIFTQAMDESSMKEAYAFVPQSTVGCITHIAVTQLQEYIEAHSRDWDILNNCHDSYLAQAPVSEVAELRTKMLEFMQQELTSPRGEKFRMRAEAQVGSNWAPYKEHKNEGGLKE